LLFDIAVQKHAVKLPAQLYAELAYYEDQRALTSSEARWRAYGLAIKIREAALRLALARAAAVAERAS
jgi:hypothetical protein